ncbi:glycosyltransferase family 2 protein [Pseudonocardia hierapolitana]|nr:glycosyltransferase family 2 protein [Pseudonocardia hierapolitana]
MQRNGNPRVSVVVPTRNEARNLEVVLPAIAAVRPAVHEIIVVDGNSVDGTIETAQRVLPWVKVITQTRKGKGNAMACGFAAATGDVIVMFDADGSADPAEIPAFVRALIDGADFAKGSRFVRGGGSDDITLLRKSGNAGLNGVANALFGTSYTDLCYGYNAFWIDILPVLDLPPIDTPAPADGSMLWGDGFEIETLLNCRVAAAGLKITEVPSMERERIFGQTNLRTFADGTRVLRTLAAERRRAARRKAERVQVEEQARALTPAGGIPVVPPAPQPQPQPVRTPPPGTTAPVNGARGGQVNGQVHAQAPTEANGQAGEPVERRPMPQTRIESQPRVDGPVRETRDGVSLRLALEEEAS